MTCIYITVVRKTGLEYTWSQPSQNINAAVKKNYIFLFSVQYLWRKPSSQSLRYLAALCISAQLPWRLVTTYLTTSGAAQFLRFPPTWIFRVREFKKTWNTSLQSRSLHPSSLMYQTGLYVTFHAVSSLVFPLGRVNEECGTIDLGTLLLI